MEHEGVEAVLAPGGIESVAQSNGQQLDRCAVGCQGVPRARLVADTLSRTAAPAKKLTSWSSTTRQMARQYRRSPRQPSAGLSIWTSTARRRVCGTGSAADRTRSAGPAPRGALAYDCGDSASASEYVSRASLLASVSTRTSRCLRSVNRRPDHVFRPRFIPRRYWPG